MEENKEEQKISFFTRLKWAIFNVENYDFFAVENLKKAIGYFIKLLVLFLIIICIPLTYVFGNYYKKSIDYIKNEMPDFIYEDGVLNVHQEEVIIQENAQSAIIINSNISSETEDANDLIKKIKSYQSGILLLKDKVLLKLPVSEDANGYEYKDILTTNRFTKSEVVDYINNIPTSSVYISFYMVSVIYLFSIYFILISMDVLLLSILGALTSRIISIKLKYTPIINISIYALTLPILLNAIYITVNMLTGFEIKYFQIMYNAISYIYLVTAILMIKSEMIKQQIELMKLAEEQKKVKEELEKQQEEEKGKQEEKKKEKEEEKKQEENEGSGEEPEGSSAS